MCWAYYKEVILLVIDFSNLNINERPVLLLKNLNGTVIQFLNYAYNIQCEFNYNETSKLSFQYPAHVDGKRITSYDKLVGMKIIEFVGIGQFILVNPSITEDKNKEIKSITCYSLEYEFTYKKISLENSTYNFWNPVARDNTIIGIILEKMPSWSVGKIDDTLVGKYRTFDVTDSNLYNFIKGTLQETYSCVFDFDTINRKINVVDVSKDARIEPVYISLDNLIKEINVEEDTENIFTCLDVNGADGVTIRNVNPMGINKIYNLDYFMTNDNFDQSLIDKWNSWKVGYKNNQELYFNLTVENALLHMQIETEKAALVELQAEKTSIEQQQSVAIEASAAGIDQDLSQYVKQLKEINKEIKEKENVIEDLESQINQSDDKLKEINKNTSWSAYGITKEEEKLIDRYIKEDSITDSTFVEPVVNNYTGKGTSYPKSKIVIKLFNSSIIGTTLTNGKIVYKALGGECSVLVNDEEKLNGPNIRSAFDILDGEVVCSIYGENGCATLTGIADLETDVKEDPEIGGSYIEGTYATLTCVSGTVYITENLSAYAQRSIEWDLFDYGQECLLRTAWPSYTFSISSGNFLSLEEFDFFRRKLTLGNKLYLNTGDALGVISPVVIGANINFETHELSLEFSDKYYSSDGAFKLADVLDQTVSMGKTVDFNKYNYNSFIDSGASTEVRDFMNSALDASKNAVLSASGQAVSWDGAGLRFRKWTDESQQEYADEQIWIINNNIVFTDDNWNSAKMAIGKFTDENAGECWGIVAPNIVGTLLAGENLVIESVKQSGGTAVFKVDADGARLFNSRFDLVNNYSDGGLTKVGQIGLNALIGIVSGSASSQDSMYSFDEKGNIIGVKTSDGSNVTRISELNGKTPVPNFWVDMYGDAYFKGTIYATDGIFGGTIKAATYLDGNGNNMMENGKWGSEYLDLYGITIRRRSDNAISFQVTESGEVNINGNITMGAGSSINWNTVTEIGQSDAYQLANTANGNASSALEKANQAYNLASSVELPDYIFGTYIDFTRVESPYIRTNELEVLSESYNGEGGFVLRGYFDGRNYDAFRIHYYATQTRPYVIMESPSGMDIELRGYYDFSNATVEGITATFA